MNSNKLLKLYSQKQIEVLKLFHKNFWILIQHGAKRAGKTIGNNDFFLMELKRIKKIANSQNVPEPQYILSGHTLGTLKRNVLNEITNRFGLRFKLNQHNEFMLFGVRVCCFGHGTERDMERMRGMTAYGAYVNEATTAVERAFREILNRCSGDGARVIVDTNPDNANLFIKKDFIDKSDGVKVLEKHYQIDDNPFLTNEYKNNIKLTTPTGTFYDRDILGLWVNAEGMVYRDFNKNIHVIDEVPQHIEISRYIIGVDWGFEHYGSMLVIGCATNGNYYIVEEHTKRGMYVENFWLPLGKSLKEKYTVGKIKPIFFVDSARSEYKSVFLDTNLETFNANKSVIEGIQTVGSLFKQNKIYILKDAIDRFELEINSYVWNNKIGSDEKVIKENDDCMDALRYAIHTYKMITR